jgi:hypothetical protein
MWTGARPAPARRWGTATQGRPGQTPAGGLRHGGTAVTSVETATSKVWSSKGRSSAGARTSTLIVTAPV